MSKFKVDDHVRVTALDRLGSDQVGDIVSMSHLYEYPCMVVLADGTKARYKEHELTLADPERRAKDIVEQEIDGEYERGKLSAPAGRHSITFDVDGVVAPQGSKKGFKRGAKIVLVEMSKNLPAWRLRIQQAARAAFTGAALDCPVSVRVTFRIPKPKATKFQDYPAGPPDTDKLQRAVGDALKLAGVITDDSRIVHWDATKVWGPAGATITVTEMRSK